MAHEEVVPGDSKFFRLSMARVSALPSVGYLCPVVV